MCEVCLDVSGGGLVEELTVEGGRLWAVRQIAQAVGYAFDTLAKFVSLIARSTNDSRIKPFRRSRPARWFMIGRRSDRLTRLDPLPQ